MKHEKISIKWKIFFFILIFILILLVGLWLLQVCYLDSFYKFIRNRTAENVKGQVIRLFDSGQEDVEESLNLLAAKNNLAIYITDTKGAPLYNAEFIATSRLNSMPPDMFENYYQMAKENGGSAKINFHGNKGREMPPRPRREEQKIPEHQEKRPIDESPLFMQNYGMEQAESVIYITILNEGQTEMVFFLNCMLTPVHATVYTLKIELLFISVVMLVLSVLLAWIISRQISKSMIRVSDSARELAKGRYDVVFEGKDYKEIADLSNTLNYMAKELVKTEKFRQELIANVSHDLRTPLTMITAYAEAMIDLPGENTPENIQVIIDEAMRLTNLVNDMLDLSKLQAGVLEKNTQKYNLTEGIRLVLARYNKLIEQDGYQILFEYDREVWILADVFKMEQVIYNLVNNAIHYTGEDKTVMVKQINKMDRIRIEVTDSGRGIAQEELPYIWERYYKAEKNHRRAVQGSGLGLSIVKNILELHQASYGIESEIGKGCTFWFELNEEAV